ncbi:rhomboid family intramembrane serine protease [soil metagenome]
MTDAATERPTLAIPEWMRPFTVVVAMVGLMWAVEVVDLVPGTDLDRWGVRPRELGGLTGIATMPFLHNGFGHLLSNTIPLLIMGLVVAASGIARFVRVTALIMVVSGLGAWLLGTGSSLHIGASGLVFGYLTYLLARAVLERKLAYLAGGAIILFLYGGVLWGLVPRPGISWQAHLFGALGGVVAAQMIHSRQKPALPD